MGKYKGAKAGWSLFRSISSSKAEYVKYSGGGQLPGVMGETMGEGQGLGQQLPSPLPTLLSTPSHSPLSYSEMFHVRRKRLFLKGMTRILWNTDLPSLLPYSF